MRHSIAWPLKLEWADNVVEVLAGGEANLGFHQIDLRHHFGDGMLDLNARVHLDEVKFAGDVAQELDCTRARIADRAEGVDYLFADALARGRVENRGRRLLEDLLVAPLERTLAFAEVDHVAVAIAQHLKLDVAGMLDQLLHVDVGTAEGLFGLGASGLKRGNQLLLGAHDAHAAPAASLGCFDHQGKADLGRHLRSRPLHRAPLRRCRESPGDRLRPFRRGRDLFRPSCESHRAMGQ